MSWRIDKIEIKNFKSFRKAFPLEVKGRNVLIFGENGTGKSSIYWSIYTFLQASFKNRDEASKYFDPDHSENLRNRFASDTDTSHISVSFSDGLGSINTFTDSFEDCFIDNEASREFIRKTAFASDFLNYKYLSALFEFENSKPNEVFSIFRKHVLPFLSLGETRKNIDNSDTNDANAGNWYDWLMNTPESLPKVANKPALIAKSPAFDHFKDELKRFNKALKEEVDNIFYDANQRLKDDFKEKVKLHADFEDARFENRQGGILFPPRIVLKAEMTGDKVKNTNKIEHPKSFFNEAKITGMALAIRLAVLNRRAPVDAAGATLFLDDMLISLDMSLRMKVLPMLLEYTKNYQLFIFTHDRATFNLVKQIVKRNEGRPLPDGSVTDLYGRWDKDWRAYELFVKEFPDGPEPLIINHNSYLDRAHAHFYAFRIPECANALRQCCEAKLKELLATKHWLAINASSGEIQDATLSNLIADFEKERKEKKFPDIAPSIDGDRQRILNPFSHDDIETPYYIEELRTALISMENLEKVRRFIFTPKERIGDKTKPYSISFEKTTEAGDVYTASAQFCFMEYFDAWEYEGKMYYGNPQVKILSTVGGHKKLKKLIKGENYTISQVCDIVRTSVSALASPIEDVIIDHSTGRKLGI